MADPSRLSASLWEFPLSGNRALDDFETPSARNGQAKGRLRAIVAAPGHAWPGEFDAARTRELLDELRRHAEYVVIDAPPLLSVTDAFPFVVAVDAVIATIRSGKTTRTAAGELRTTLERIGARSIELVVTELEHLSHTYYTYRPSTKRLGGGTLRRSMRSLIARR
jgi:Mrp family chromosome partitioning ATPase